METLANNPFLRGFGGKVQGSKEVLDALATVTAPQQRAPRNLPVTRDQVERLQKGTYATDAPNRAQRRQQAKQQQEHQRRFAARDARRAAERARVQAEHQSRYNVAYRYAGFWHALRRTTSPRGCQAINPLTFNPPVSG